MEIVVPGSVANLGGGFDTLGVAVQLYLRARIVDVRDDGAGKLSVGTSRPAVSGPNAIERAYAHMVVKTGWRAPSVVVDVESDIPMAAGLGSSAAASVAGLRIFEQVTRPFANATLTESALLAAATALEGHGDNAAAAICGGLTSVVEASDTPPVIVRWDWPQELKLVVATPDVGLATSKARAALPDALPRADAVFNLQRVLSLVHALQRGDYGRLRQAVEDRWHQPARRALVPQLADAMAIDDPDVLGAFLSGAGPSVAVLATSNLAKVKGLLERVYQGAGCPAIVRILDVHQSVGVASTTSGRSV
ncbi:MAG: homoserine kinase [Vicinamibacterales bacterium]